MKKAVLYGRTSPQEPLDAQFTPLRDIAAQRGFESTGVYSDVGISGGNSKRPGVSALLRDAKRGKFSVILVDGFDRLARSTRNFLEIVDQLDSLGIELIFVHEAVDTGTPSGKIFVATLRYLVQLEKNLIRERIKGGIRRRKLEGLPIGRQRLDVDRAALVQDRLAGMSLTHLAKRYGVSRPTVVRWVREAKAKPSSVVGSSATSRKLTEEVAA